MVLEIDRKAIEKRVHETLQLQWLHKRGFGFQRIRQEPILLAAIVDIKSII